VLREIATRVLWAAFTIWAVVTIAFFINQTLPSDPARAVAGPQARPRDVARIRVELGLDRPVLAQYRIFMGRLVHLETGGEGPRTHSSCARLGPLHVDLGTSYQMRRPVLTILGERLPRTFFLALAAVFVQVLLGITFGVIAAVKRHTPLDHGTVALSLVGISAPTFLTGILLQYIFGFRLRWLPLDGYGGTLREQAASIVLPAITLGIAGAAYYTRLVRDDMIDLLKQDFVRTARAKGVSPFGVVVRHALRNALVPLVTVIGLDLGALVGGAIVTEKLFRWPGLGQLSVDSVFARDAPIVLGTVIVASTAVVLSNLVVDLSYRVLDPRVRTQ